MRGSVGESEGQGASHSPAHLRLRRGAQVALQRGPIPGRLGSSVPRPDDSGTYRRRKRRKTVVDTTSALIDGYAQLQPEDRPCLRFQGSLPATLGLRLAFAAPQHWTAWFPILPWKGCRRFGIRLYCVRRPSLRDFSA